MVGLPRRVTLAEVELRLLVSSLLLASALCRIASGLMLVNQRGLEQRVRKEKLLSHLKVVERKALRRRPNCVSYTSKVVVLGVTPATIVMGMTIKPRQLIRIIRQAAVWVAWVILLRIRLKGHPRIRRRIMAKGK